MSQVQPECLLGVKILEMWTSTFLRTTRLQQIQGKHDTLVQREGFCYHTTHITTERSPTSIIVSMISNYQDQSYHNKALILEWHTDLYSDLPGRQRGRLLQQSHRWPTRKRTWILWTTWYSWKPRVPHHCHSACSRSDVTHTREGSFQRMGTANAWSVPSQSAICPLRDLVMIWP